MGEPLLSIESLAVEYEAASGNVKALRGVDLTVEHGRTLAIVGESGSGKSTLALSLARLAPGKLSGSIRFRRADGSQVDIASLDPRGREIRALRGREIGFVFQEPAAALNPVYTIGEQIAESLRLHRGLSRRDAREEAIRALAAVGINDPAARAHDHPHTLSGGMRQRVTIAIALAGRPRLLIADEPTASLDVTVQAGILDLLRKLQTESQLTLVLVTHDLGIVSEIADDVAVIYAGRIVERGIASAILRAPRHPYTAALVRASALPMRPPSGERVRLGAIPGSVPDPRSLPSGCPFHPRCPERFERCDAAEPALIGGVACFAREPAPREAAGV